MKFAKRNPLVFMIDSGSERNLIKRGIVNTAITRNQSIKFTGISEGYVEAVGTVEINLRGLNSSKEFYQTFFVVSENFQLEVDGMLGQDFLKDLNVKLDFMSDFTILTSGNEEIPLPLLTFYDAINLQKEYQKPLSNIICEHLTLKDSKRLKEKTESFICPETLLVLPNTINIFAITTYNKNAFYCKGYEIKPSIYIGDVISAPNLGFCNIVLLNTSNELVKLTNLMIIAESLDQFMTTETPQGEPRKNRLNKLQLSVNKDALNTEEKSTLTKIINENNKVFYLPRDVALVEIPEIASNPFMISLDETEEMIISKFLDTSFMMLIAKDTNTNNRWTTVLDFRKLQTFIRHHTIKLTPTEEVLEKLGTAMYVSIFQMTQGPNEFTQFSKNLTLNENILLERNIKITFAGLFLPLSLIFFRRIICVSNDFETHQNDVISTLQLLAKNNLKIQPTTSQLFSKNILYAGHEIIETNVIANETIIQQILQMHCPRTLKEVKLFYRKCKYFAKFIPEFNSISHPIFKLVEKNLELSSTNNEWNEFMDNSFYELKDLISKVEPLKLHDFTQHMLLLVNRSDNSISCSLAQGTIEKYCIILNNDKVLTNNEKEMTSLELDLLSVTWSLKICHHFLIYNKFTLVTTNQSLSWLLKNDNMPTDLIDYRLEIEKYNFNISVKKDQTSFPIYKIQIKDTDMPSVAQNTIKDGRQLSKDSISIPQILKRPAIMRKFHLNFDGSHRNMAKMKNRISREYKWPGMFKDIEAFIDDCPDCTRKPEYTEKIVEHPDNVNNLKMQTIVVPLYPTRECL